jgi:hypothetical protein
MTDTEPDVAGEDGESATHRRRVRVRRRIKPVLRMSRRRQQLLSALILALVAAVAVAWFVGATLDNPEGYIPAAPIH